MYLANPRTGMSWGPDWTRTDKQLPCRLRLPKAMMRAASWWGLPEAMWLAEASFCESAANESAGILMYNWEALLDQRPIVWIKWSGIPLCAATVAAPMRKLWDENLPGIRAEVMICQSQSVRLVRVRGCQDQCEWSSLAWTDQSWSPRSVCTWKMALRKSPPWHPGHSNEGKKRHAQKAKLPQGTSSPKTSWSGRPRSRDCQIISINKSSVIGNHVEEGVPRQRLIPRTTLCRQRQSASGSGNPWSMWRALMPDKLTLMDECWRVLARKVTKRKSGHSSLRHGDPEECNLPSCWQKEINFAWANA